MDLFQTLVQTRTEFTELHLEGLLQELLTYTRLMKLPAFRIISKQTKGRLPRLTEALAGKDATQYVLLDMVQMVLCGLEIDAPIVEQILKTNKTNQSKRDQKLRIVSPVTVTQQHLSRFDELAQTEEMYGFTEEELVALVTVRRRKNNLIDVVVYTGDMPDMTLTEFEERPPYGKGKLVIHSFSPQGNNDYVFGTYGGKGLSMPNESVLCIGEEVKELTESEQHALQLRGTDIEKLAEALERVIIRDK